MAPLMLMLLAQEDTDPIVQAVTGQGRAFHRRWVADLFRLDSDAADDEEQIDLLVVATDLNVSLSAHLKSKNKGEGGITLGAKALHDIISNLPGEEIEVAIIGGGFSGLLASARLLEART